MQQNQVAANGSRALTMPRENLPATIQAMEIKAFDEEVKGMMMIMNHATEGFMRDLIEFTNSTEYGVCEVEETFEIWRD